MTLDELVAALVEVNIRDKIMEREDNLEKLFKCTSKSISEYDNKTVEMIELLHKTRDEQVNKTDVYSILEMNRYTVLTSHMVLYRYI